MNLLRSRFYWGLFGIFVLCSIRFVWVVAQSKTGIEPHLAVCREAISDSLYSHQMELAARDPVDQASFWLSKLGDLGQTTDDSRVAMGVAWLLDSPQGGFRRRHITIRKTGPYSFPEIDSSAIGSLLDAFYEACDEKCLLAINRAVELAPDEPEVWRNKSVLLFRCPLNNPMALVPRTPDWLRQLDECAKHDPDNGLYDYIAAVVLYRQSTSQRFDVELDDIV